MEKLYYTIGEVSEILGESASLVRFWTNSFPKVLKPKRNAKGNRLYTKDDLAALQQIHLLVKEQGMTWPQMWNGEDIENSPAAMYAVRAIPSTFLIDADGTIIGRNLRGEELDAALEDYFK